MSENLNFSGMCPICGFPMVKGKTTEAFWCNGVKFEIQNMDVDICKNCGFKFDGFELLALALKLQPNIPVLRKMFSELGFKIKTVKLEL